MRFVGKEFRQRVPDSAGGYTWKLNGTRRVLYRLPDVIADDGERPVYIVEGEKDADAMWARGFTATTSPQAAGNWKFVAEHAHSVLAGRNVVVIADRDEVGRKHAREIAESLSDVAASVRVATTPAPHKDVSDLFAARGRLEPFSDGAEIARPLDDLPYLVAKLGIVTGGSPPHMIAGFGYSTKSLSAQDANRTTRAASPSSAGSVSGPVKESKK